MRNTFSISLDHGQTPEGLRATVASRNLRVFYFLKNPFRFVSNGVR
jgi:hypothetical protein